MSKKLNFAILGAGNIAASMALAVNKITDNVNFYGIASRNIDKAKEFARKWNVEKYFGSYEELTMDNNVDLIYIATPHSEHYQNALLCISNRQNCLIEKAFCRNSKEAAALINKAKENNVFLAEAMWTRYQPGIGIIKNCISKYNLGKILKTNATFNIDARGVERLEKPKLAGGALLDLGVYSLTVAAMFLGTDIEDFRVNYNLNENKVDLNNDITIYYSDGKEARAISSFGNMELKNEAEILCENGFIKFGPINVPTHYEVYSNNQLIFQADIPLIANGYEYEVLECCKCIEDGLKEAPSMPLSETLRIMNWMDTIRSEMGVMYPGEYPLK